MKKATRQQTKLHNGRLILKTIYDHGIISRADIARQTRLTPTTVSTVVEEQIAAKLVNEVGPGLSSGGKRPTLLTVNESGHSIIAVDLSDDLFRGSVTDLRGKILTRFTLDSVEDGKTALDQVIALVRRLIENAPYPLLGIGIGSRGVVDIHAGVILQAVRFGWKDVPLEKVLEDTFRLPVFIANDSAAAALAEYAFKSNGKVDNLIMIQVGEGISAGILLNGRLYYGDGFGAGEIGHTCTDQGGELCRCGHYGCLETVATSRALVKSAWRGYRQNPASLLRQLVDNPELITLETLQTACEHGDPDVVASVNKAGLHLGRAVANIVGLLNIQHIYITGKLLCFGEGLLNPIRKEMVEDCLDTFAKDTVVEPAFQPEDMIMLGAAALLLREQLGVV